ncbi:ftsj methyltransferase domain-containing protein 1 [Cotonvirus japonicus]|uniref:Ftsj methyltransferase domain-containing protein 1 n=1 Tax=Cotonvirus japonicus TaxID=2811091 RepID=A0ABM7NT07_9VIRU|nr:ftsj methyltransferase domain-containing protein 1 [Cotonvirus japonicus]BCS83310.1 ftsj methyltransferase domain-containing protein 1 [Cotonvirus japonicus]
MDCVLNDTKISKNEISQKIKTFMSNTSLLTILTSNKYEKLIPFNLWFDHDLYIIHNNRENYQNIRIRTYKNSMLTPLVAFNEENLNKISSFLPNLSLYQPFYPETFYEMWEFLHTDYLKKENSNFLFVGKDNKLGSFESLIIYNERYKYNYLSYIYDIWITCDKNHYDYNGDYIINDPEIDYLGQAFNVSYLTSTSKLYQYDFVIIDNVTQLNSEFQWNSQEKDFQALLFYFFTVINHLKPGASLLIKLNLMCTSSWNYLFDIGKKYFQEHAIFRSKTTNMFNPEIYLFLNIFRDKKTVNSLAKTLVYNAHKYKLYELFELILPCSNNNILTKEFHEIKNQWSNTIYNFIKNPVKPLMSKCYLSKWHNKFDLHQIKHLCNVNDVNVTEFTPLNVLSKIKIKPVINNLLYDNETYLRLLNKKAELNYYKRVMDTKPSKIFVDLFNQHDNSENYLMTWDYISGKLDTYKKIKYLLKTNYCAEMVTNAWIKLYEMLSEYPNLLGTNKIVKTFHLCEAPGAFISATNHYLNSNKRQLIWFAQTLNPEKDEDFALKDHYGLMAEYPDKWLFGPDKYSSGDITDSRNIKFYASNQHLKDIDFMTADAGILCSPNNINEQESILCKINMGQIICILACLSVGKSAIFKTFLPMTEPLNISMICLLTTLFEKIIFHKPKASNSSNSEIYIILENYKGISSNLLDLLYVMLDDPKIDNNSFILDTLDKEYMKSYSNIVNVLINNQINSLKKIYYYYYHSKELHELYDMGNSYQIEWFKLHNINCLSKFLLTNN